MGPPVGSPNQGPGALGRGRPGAWDREKENDGQFLVALLLEACSSLALGSRACGWYGVLDG